MASCFIRQWKLMVLVSVQRELEGGLSEQNSVAKGVGGWWIRTRMVLKIHQILIPILALFS